MYPEECTLTLLLNKTIYLLYPTLYITSSTLPFFLEVEDGWTQGVCQEEPGFARLLINSLERLDIIERPDTTTESMSNLALFAVEWSSPSPKATATQRRAVARDRHRVSTPRHLPLGPQKSSLILVPNL
jgi:hypothetical protein